MLTRCAHCQMVFPDGEGHLEVLCRLVQAARILRDAAAGTKRGHLTFPAEFDRLAAALADVDEASSAQEEAREAEGVCRNWEIPGDSLEGQGRRISPYLDLADLSRNIGNTRLPFIRE